MKTYLANAWSAGMLPAGAPAALDVVPVTPEEARTLAVGAESIVGHADTAAVLAELLGRPVAHNRVSVTLAPGDDVLVAQLEGGRLPEGARTLPEGASVRWMRVRWKLGAEGGPPPSATPPPEAVSPPATRAAPERVVPPAISAPFHDPAFVGALADRTEDAGGPLDVLVAIPSNDAVLALAVATHARKVLLLVTGAEWRTKGRAYEVWLRANMTPPPQVHFLPEDEDDVLDERNLIAQLHEAVRRSKRVGVLVTTGTSVHTALLSHYAHARGARTLHVTVPYVGGRPEFQRPERGFQLLEVPAEVRHRLREEEARELALGGNFERARQRLDHCDTLGTRLRANLDWIDMLDAREALRLDEARVALGRLQGALQRLTNAEKANAEWSLLVRSAERATRALVATEPGTLAHELHFAAEAFHRAGQETRRGRLDLAALLYYRFTESAVAVRLRYACAPSIEPDQGLGGETFNAHADALADVARAVHGARARGLAPGAPLGLVNGLIVLHALGDPVVHGWEQPVKVIQTLKELSESRNKSIFAHGFQAMQPADLARWREVAHDRLFRFFNIGERPVWGGIFGAHEV